MQIHFSFYSSSRLSGRFILVLFHALSGLYLSSMPRTKVYLPEVTNNDLRRQFFPKHSRTARIFGTLPNYGLAISHHTKGTSTPSSHRAPDTRSFKPSSRRIVSRQWGRDRQRNEREFPILFFCFTVTSDREVSD